MERRVRGNLHARCGVGEKLEITSKVYLSPFGITRAEEELYLTNAQMRTLYGRTNMNPVSRFIGEIPADLIDNMAAAERVNTPFGVKTQSQAPRRPVARPRINTASSGTDWKVGDKASHKKWGTGTVVSVKGSGDGVELDIAFPSPTGIKRLLAKFAPIQKA